MAPPTSVGGQSTPSASSPCFEPDDGGYYGVLYHAVRAYIDQDCANNKEREIAQTYGWPMNSWCVGNVKSMSYLFEYMDTFNEDINGWDTSSVTSMGYMFSGASSFNGDVSNFNFNTSSVTDMDRMFYGATSFNMDLCPWQDNFPYTNAADIFTNSGCTYQDTPNETQKGPFCASDCQSSQVVSCVVCILLYLCVISLSADTLFFLLTSQLLIQHFQRPQQLHPQPSSCAKIHQTI